ncbi:hypothetical protein GC174_13095 [bacterium]|nr:hypothetical protein [bacterium]
MRDNSDGMMELLGAHKEGGQYFVQLSVVKNDSKANFQFGVTEKGYAAIKQVLQSRPFDAMPGIQYRYYISNCLSPHSLTARIESQNDGKEISVDIPEDLAKNLFWFHQIKDLSEAEYLRLDD